MLWQYLVDQKGLNCSQSSFRRWITQHKEFQEYFDSGKNRVVNGVKKSSKKQKP